MKAELAKHIKERKCSTFRIPADGECRYRVGKPYQIKAATDTTPAEHITITDVREQTLGEITKREAAREGFKSTSAFFEAWVYEHRSLERDQPIYVVSFIRGDQSDTPRLLAARPGGTQGDYVSSSARAARGESEAVDAQTLSSYAKEAKDGQSVARNVLWEDRRARLLVAIADVAQFATSSEQLRSFKLAERTIKSHVRKVDEAA